jgi:hypothetical protein
LTAKELRAKRAAAGIPGHVVCQLAHISRAKLSDVERGYVTASPKELHSIDCAIARVLETRKHLAALATEAGLCLTGIRL